MTDIYKNLQKCISTYMINDLTNIVLQYYGYRLKDIKCTLCNYQMRMFEEDQYEADSYWKYNISTDMNCLYCTNPKCDTYCILCENCSTIIEDKDYKVLDESYPINLCQFLGYDNWDHSDSDTESDTLDTDTEDEPKITEMQSSQLDVDKIGISYVNKNQYHVNQDEIENGPTGEKLTGPDGGFYHYWRCNVCHSKYSLTDK
jgi:hypothetical protein